MLFDVPATGRPWISSDAILIVFRRTFLPKDGKFLNATELCFPMHLYLSSCSGFYVGEQYSIE